MPRPLRNGFIRASTIFKTAGEYQIKIGSDRYKSLVNRRKSSNIYQTRDEKRRTKNLSVTLPKMYSEPTFKGLTKLIKRKHKFSVNDEKIAFNVLKDLQEGKQKKYLKIKLEDNTLKHIPINDKSIESITNTLSRGYFSEQAYNTGSDAINQILAVGIKDIELGTVRQRNMFKSGSFFRYLNTTDINLERYQIISNTTDKKIMDDHCLTYCLKQYNIDEEIINRVKTTFETGSFFPKKNLKEVSNIIKKNINLVWYDAKGNRRNCKYTKTYDETINIALYEDHYFINEITNYTPYSSKHYKEIKHIKDFNKIYRKDNKYYVKNDKLKIDSLTLIKNLFETDNFIKDHNIIKSFDKYQRNKDKAETLSLIDEEQRLYEYKSKEEDNKTIIFYADIETDVHGDTHKPILMRFTKTGDLIDHGYTYEREELDEDYSLFNRFMNSIDRQSRGYKKVIIYFHNLKYDYNTIKSFINHLGAPCEKDGQLYNVKFKFKFRNYEFRDSLKLAPMRLADFQKSFGLDKDLNKKEAIAYEYYTINNMCDRVLEVDIYEQYLKEDDKKIFRQALEDNYLFRYRKDKKSNKMIFDPIEYYKYYLKYDTYILMKGLEKFEQIINDIVSELNKKYNTNHNINLFDYLTISSLTHAIMGAFGCYDDVYEMCGNLRQFCGNFVTGGRVQVNEEYNKKVIKQKIADYDGVSLYPSAIKRLCEERGLPKGKAKPIQTYNKKELDKYDYYMVKIIITKINKYQQLPMVSYKNKDGILQYVNEIKEPIITYTDMITLNDWIEFQDIEYEILDGVYYNNGFNKRMGDIILHLFNNRLKHKKQKNQAMQLILKLMMNSSYGKTITKKTMTRKVIINDNKKEQYIANYFHLIKEFKQITDRQWEITLDAVDTTYNMAQVGSFILSYSKRIMNEVFNIANTHKCPLYYTDTDSIHCNYDDVITIENEFRKTYNRELTGKQLGQFHIDFDLDGACSEIYAVKSIFLGKKAYIDILESTDAKGNKITGYHYRLKGVNEQGIRHRADNDFKGDIFSVYQYLSNGDSLDFVLNPQGMKPSFEYNDAGVRTKESGEFIRTVKF